MTSYQDIRRRVEELTPDEQIRLLEELAVLVHRRSSPPRSILELQGLGKEIWRGIDAQQYVDRERDSWNG